jgi:LuxR family quorum sensing-dependent transcriptional regulator
MQRSVEMSSGFGWRESLVIPLGPAGTRRAIVSLKGPRGTLSHEEREILTRAGTAFYDRLRTFGLSPPPLEAAIDLTAREAGCLALIALGLNDEAIGDQLGISRATAHKHIENSKRKLRALNRTHAIAIAVRRGLISL